MSTAESKSNTANKVDGLSYDVLAKGLEQARQGRLYILDKILETIPVVFSDIPRQPQHNEKNGNMKNVQWTFDSAVENPLSRKPLLPKPEGYQDEKPRREGGDRGGERRSSGC